MRSAMEKVAAAAAADFDGPLWPCPCFSAPVLMMTSMLPCLERSSFSGLPLAHTCSHSWAPCSIT